MWGNQSNFSTLQCDSGWLPTTETWTTPDHCVNNDLNNTSPGNTYYWRARAEDNHGLMSGWTSARTMYVVVPLNGSRSNWAMWQHGPIAVNEASGQLVVTMPGPSFASVGGPLSVTLTHNAYDQNNIGLGKGWQVNAVSTDVGVPTKLVDHTILTGSAKSDAVELKYPDGSSRWFNHVTDTTTFVPRFNHPGDLVSENTTDSSWTYTDASGVVFVFNPENTSSGAATLKSMTLPQYKNGVGTITYTYSSSDPSKLDHITDPSGRKISLYWANTSVCGTGTLLCVKLYDANGTELTTWTYYSDANGNLNRINDGVRDLYKLTYNGDRITQIQNANDLDPTNASPGYNATHSLQIAYTLGADGHYDVTSVSDGPIYTQPSGKQTSTWTFAYHGAGSN